MASFFGKKLLFVAVVAVVAVSFTAGGKSFSCFQCAKIQKRIILRKMMGKIIIFAIVTQSPMSEEGKKIDDEEKTIPNPEGYTIVKYAEGWVDFIVLVLSLVVLTFILCAFKDVFMGRLWLFLLIDFGVLVLLWVIGRKITEVKVNLKITDEGLEQTRLSGSKLYPEHRLIKWEDMKRYHLYGRGRGNEFYIVIKGDTNFRISTPLFSLFEKQKENKDSFAAFQDDFWEIASEHDVHRAFFG